MHLASHAIIARFFEQNLFVHRLVSIGFALLLMRVAYCIILSSARSRNSALAGLAIFLSTPGFSLQASLATSEIIVTPILLIGLWYFAAGGHSCFHKAIFTGLILAVAISTRVTAVVVIPSVVIWAAFSAGGFREKFAYPIAAVISAALFCSLVYFFVINQVPDDYRQVVFQRSLDATGLTNFPSTALFYNLDGLLLGSPWALLFLIVVPGALIWVNTLNKSNNESLVNGRLPSLLYIAGLVGGVAWLLFAPIPHIRYLWPALPLLMLSLILSALPILRYLPPFTKKSGVHITILCVCIFQFLINIRTLAVGDALALTYESANLIGRPKDYNGFDSAIHQKYMSEVIHRLPPEARVYTMVKASSYPVAYLSGRPVKSLLREYDKSDQNYLLIMPSDGAIWRPKWLLIDWIQHDTKLLQSHGNYSLHKINADASPPALRAVKQASR